MAVTIRTSDRLAVANGGDVTELLELVGIWSPCDAAGIAVPGPVTVAGSVCARFGNISATPPENQQIPDPTVATTKPTIASMI